MESTPLIASSEGVQDTTAVLPSQPANNHNQDRKGVEDSLQSPISPSGEEQALESHEVIELQSFSERKAWIEEKIKFLEALPPVEVFIGLSAIQSSLENVPGLPTRTELQQWMVEHDVIEKETEMFDTGELKKLRQLTKAATQRNLSPEDTDVIELTLTTIYALDKLLHLLRDRSENLEMMSTRLLWEESRQASWKEQRQIIEDLRRFATDRARWNAAVYDDLSSEIEDHTVSARRGSIASQASANSDNIINSPAFSRSTRFKFTEMLSRDAAQFSGRITSLKHGKVAAAGKALDKLIDQSRKPVPDEFLDEQDRLEEKCINEMENVSKFTMNLVMQWRKADEIYVETKKDYITASVLLEEIETAKLYHPTARQNSSFVSRADTILKRLAIRGDPASHSKMFPRPEHFIFPDQKLANENLIKTLATDIASANKLANTVNLAAKEYKELYDGVRKVETLLQNVSNVSMDISLVIKKFQEGVPSEDEDGSPPILTSESCLNAASHALYIALFPSLLEEAVKAIKAADEHLRASPALLRALDNPGIEKQFKEGATAELQKLSSLRDQVISVRDSTTKRLARLRDSRRISALIDSKLAFLRTTKKEIVFLIERDRWRQQFGGMEAPPTPESPVTDLSPSPSSNLEFEKRLSEVSFAVNSDIIQPLNNLSGDLESELHEHLDQRIASLQRSLEDGQQTFDLLGRIRKQSSAMADIRNDFHDIITRIEDTKLQLTNLIDTVLDDPKLTDMTKAADISTQGDVDIGLTYLDPLQATSTAFVDGLSKRVLFVARYSASATNRAASNRAASNRAASLKSPSLLSGFGVSASDESTVIPFDLGSLDSIVRADSNSYALRINGGIESLLQQKGHYELSKIAKAVNSTLLSVATQIDLATQVLSEQKTLIVKTSRQLEDTDRNLCGILNSLKATQSQHAKIVLALPPIEEEIMIMDSRSKNLDSRIRDGLYKPQSVLFREIEDRSKKLGQEITDFVDVVQKAIAMEQQYWDGVKQDQIRRAKEEQERLAAEEETRVQLERQKTEEEERQKALDLRLAEERKKDAETLRQMAELAEKQRAEKEAAELEKLRLVKLEEEAELARVRAQEERRAQGEAERARLEQERMDAVQKLHSIEAELEKERRLHVESGLAAADLAYRQRTEMDQLTKRQEEMEALAQESIYRAEMERINKERMEKEAKEHEEHFLKRYSELQQLADDQARLAEIERSERERAERIAQGYVEVLTEQHVKALRLAEENARQIEFERTEKERAEREADKLAQELEHQKIRQRTINDNRDTNVQQSTEYVQDVFGILESPAISSSSTSESFAHLQTQIMTLRKRLRSICVDEILFPTKGSTQLPTNEQFQKTLDSFTGVIREIQLLPTECNNKNLEVELASLRVELGQSQQSLQKIQQLVDLSSAIQISDNALSDLLEHIDSYPAAPLLLSSTHTSLPTASSEEKLTSRLTFTENLLKEMDSNFVLVASDHRAVSEHSRVNQTWAELREMASDRLNGRKSRPSSVISSGMNSSVSTNPGPAASTRGAKKKSSYSHLSVSSMSSPVVKGKMLAPPVPPAKPRRVVSGTNESAPRSSSRSSIALASRSASGSISMGKNSVKSNEVGGRSTSRMSSASSTRSVSGPLNTSLHGSTFASRQRTTSLSAVAPTAPRRSSLTPSRFRMNDEIKRGISPVISETSSYSRSHSSVGPRTSLNASTWSRAPRDSLSSLLPRVGTPHKKVPPVRKKYVADPKSKLDVAVGDVVNQLEVGINIEGITESWRDQSGKYWIGNQDPKLCFCRILRSQTVMVRVGGGWTELSKFIKDHFAESFQIGVGLSSPPRSGSQTEKWISSMTLLEARESLSPPRGPTTPEPSFVPSFSLVTPSGHSPKSIKSLSPTSLKSSPLTPLQFMRRAEPVPDNSLLRPATPSKPPRSGRTSTSSTPARASVWRP